MKLAELHVHLEGTVRYETALELAAAKGAPPPPPYRYSDLPGFFDVYLPVARSMVTADDFERVILEHAETMHAQRIDYAEISVNPSLHEGVDWTAGMASGRDRARHAGVEIAWLFELVRGLPSTENEWAVDFALDTDGVVGLGLVGDESVSAADLKPLIDRARKAGLGFMPHAGQAGGPEVVREAVDVLGATRIAHGVAAAQDEVLMRSLADRGICLCICPSSNARIGLKPDYRVLAGHGIPLTVNTDDPAMVGTTLERELEVAEKDFGLSRSDLIEAAWSHRFS
jgi:adenosine deaminase